MRLVSLWRSSLRARLIVAVGMMILPLLVLSASGYYSLQRATNALAETARETFQEINPIERIHIAMLQAAAVPHDYLINGQATERRNFSKMSLRVDSAFDTLLTGRSLARAQRATVLSAFREWQKIKPMGRSLLAIPDPVGNPSAAAKMKRLDARLDQALALLEKVHAQAHLDIARHVAATSGLQARMILIFTVVFSFTLGGAIIIGVTLTASILRPLAALTDSAARFAAGDLAHRAPKLTNDELGQFAESFNFMVERLEIDRLALAEQTTRFKAIFDTATDAIISIDTESKITFVNRAAERYFGYSSDDILGKNSSILMPERFRGAHSQGIAGYIVSGKNSIIGAQTELVGLRKDGTEFPIELSVAAWESAGQTFFTGIIRDVTDRKATERLLKQMSITDSLTGLYNHAEFYRRLREELERSRRYGSPVALLMLDIDYFKDVNDTYGHQAGDNVLLALADIIVKTIRPIDKPARYGGEEFTVILPETDTAGALATAERLRRRVEERVMRIDHDRTVRITVSIGVAECPSDAKSEDTLVSQADKAMYASKTAGRNRVAALKRPT